MPLFAVNPSIIRSKMELDNFMPMGYKTLEQLDEACGDEIDAGRLLITSGNVTGAHMESIKKQDIGIREFRRFSKYLLTALTHLASVTTSDEDVKIAISVRAGNAFLVPAYEKFSGSEIGFITQERDEVSKQAASNPEKLGSFAGKHAVIMDPMNATGGSMIDAIEAVTERGATGITTVNAFTAPQGLIRIASHPAVTNMVSLPLEAGLSKDAFIVGGHANPMLGDFGDRFFGPVS